MSFEKNKKNYKNQLYPESSEAGPPNDKISSNKSQTMGTMDGRTKTYIASMESAPNEEVGM
jgi:hypothetical protein